MQPIRAYEVIVQGFPPMLYSARTPAKARSRCWRDYQAASDCTFAQFLKISRIQRAPWADERHERVLVNGKPATLVIHSHRRDLFIYDDGDDVMCAHHSEIVRVPMLDLCQPETVSG